MKKIEIIEAKLDTIVGGGQTLGSMPDGRKLFVWGGLPGETVRVQLTKKKSHYAEGIVTEVLTPSPERIQPRDDDSFVSTSPWQVIEFDAEQRYKAKLIEEAFELHNTSLPGPTEVYSDGNQYHYRNKVEFSWYGNTISGVETLHLAFFRRGSGGKIIVEDSALLPLEMMDLARSIRDTLQAAGVSARQLKTLLIRCDAKRSCVWQLYVKDTPCPFIDTLMQADLPAQGGEIIYSNPKSPASIITERLASTGDTVLSDTILGVPFHYATEGFFQINLPVYEQALYDMKKWVATPAAPSPTKFTGMASALRGSVSDTSLVPAELASAQTSSSRQEVSSAASRACADVPENLLASGWVAEDENKRVTPGGAAPGFCDYGAKGGADQANGVPEKFTSWGIEAGPVRSELRANSEGIRDDGSGKGMEAVSEAAQAGSEWGGVEAVLEKEGDENKKSKVLDLYSGVGSIGLTIGGEGVTLVEINEHAVREMERNIKELGINATPILAASEQALEYITSDKIIIVDPPRAGLHKDVVDRLLEVRPPRIIYLSCNPVTQARDVALLQEGYDIVRHKGYNFFPRTPHIEQLVICDRKP